jgi:glycosyltransferase involved in cell wall biosynthesis
VAAPCRIAIASSGLGHIRRGVESWAADLGQALHRAGEDITLFQAKGPVTEPWQRVLPCVRRFEPPAARILNVTRRLGGWRYGFGSEYEIEQSTFAFSLWRDIRSDYDILNVQDPLVALILDRLHRAGLSRPVPILAHGTEEEPERLRKYSVLQHLSPVYREEWKSQAPASQLNFAIPNFIDTEKFRPGDRPAMRRELGLPEDALIVLCVAALKKHHKRCDVLIREFAAFRSRLAKPALLIIAGARENETPEIVELGKQLLGDSVLILEGLPRPKLVSYYQAADIFALASLSEMFPIALLEALGCGLPITCNNTPTLSLMAGPGGRPEDIGAEGGLVRQWMMLADPAVRRAFSEAARAHALETYSEPVVIRQYTEMYRTVAGTSRRAAAG